VTRSARWATVCWIAVTALLADLLLPVVASIGLAGERDSVVASRCGAAAERDHAGKANPGVAIHHCALCTLPGAPSLRAGGASFAGGIAESAYPAVRPGLAFSPYRHGPLQARAPPVAA